MPHVSHRKHVFDSPSPCERGVHPRPQTVQVNWTLPRREQSTLLRTCYKTGRSRHRLPTHALLGFVADAFYKVKRFVPENSISLRKDLEDLFCFWSQDLQVSIFKLEGFTDSVFLCTWAVYYYTKLLNIVLFIPVHSVKRGELVLFSVRTRSFLICNDG